MFEPETGVFVPGYSDAEVAGKLLKIGLRFFANTEF